MLCRCLAVSRAAGSTRGSGGPSRRMPQRDRRLRVLVRASFDGEQTALREPADSRDLLEQAGAVSRKRVIRLMQEDGLEGARPQALQCTTMSDHDQPVAANVLDRQFTADAPNQRWVGDTTEFVIGEQRQAVSGRDPGSVLPVRRRLGGQRRQRPASDAQGAGDGAEAPLSRRRACCTTRTRAARTRARTTRRSSTRTASRAA